MEKSARDPEVTLNQSRGLGCYLLRKRELRVLRCTRPVASRVAREISLNRTGNFLILVGNACVGTTLVL